MDSAHTPCVSLPSEIVRGVSTPEPDLCPLNADVGRSPAAKCWLSISLAVYMNPMYWPKCAENGSLYIQAVNLKI